jgi:hypothetical protein
MTSPWAWNTAVAVAADDSIVIAGSERRGTTSRALVASPAGRLDRDFGAGGRPRLNFGGMWDEANDIAMLPNGDVVVAGTTERRRGRSHLALARVKRS